jgi:predicted ATP-grasp superfamily ATP-dependent carboligase
VPTLLFRADYNGTLAASRCLASRGVQVTLATDSILAFSRWSNSVARVVACPGFSDGPAVLAKWLIEYGRNHEKSVLYPTCDELAWLAARYREELSPYFYMYSPGPATLETLLDKRRLYEAANAVGIGTPRTWYPREDAELAAIMAEASGVIVKPRSQTFYRTHAKGERATRLAQLRQIWKRYRGARFAREVADSMSDVGLPMVQEYLPHTASRVVSISGFADKSGRFMASRASCKVLQMPRRAGVGLCFESVLPDPQLQQALEALCAHVGYYGVFEAEFAEHDGRQLLIDFNPRYFGQMGFDIARGMPLPWLAQLCATGQEQQARQLAVRNPPPDEHQYCADSLALRWHLFVGRLLGAVTAPERRRWIQWLSARPDVFHDAIASRTDRGPAIASVISRLWSTLAHPRAYWRSLRPHAALISVLLAENAADYLCFLGW